MQVSGRPPAPSESHAARLLGAWQLLVWTIDSGDGRPPTFPFGPDAKGLLVYEPGGWMSVTIGATGRYPLSGGSQKGAPPVEQVAAYESFFSYAGTWTVVRNAVLHTIVLALNPGLAGTTQRREISWMPDGELVLATSEPRTAGRSRRHHLSWRRADPQPTVSPAPIAPIAPGGPGAPGGSNGSGGDVHK